MKDFSELGYGDRVRVRIVTEIEDSETRVRALSLVENYFENVNWSGKSPDSIVASAEYAARRLLGSDKFMSQLDICDKHGVSEKAIQDNYGDIINPPTEKDV